jgi:hypothetical protein
MVLAAPARDSSLTLHYALAALAACGLVTEVPVHAGMRCNSGRSETLPRRPSRLSPETLNVFSVPLRLNTHSQLEQIALSFLRFGTIDFRGPAAHIARMEEQFIRPRGWLSHADFLDTLVASNLIPGLRNGGSSG